MPFRFHFLGMPHVAINRDYNCCAYSMKVLKGLKMLTARGHEAILYANEGSTAQFGEVVPILSEAERQSFFGVHDRQRLYDLRWDPTEPYWRLFNSRAVEALKPRVRRGDFILTLSGNCQVGPIGDAFSGSYSGIAQTAMMVEWGIGYYGTQSRYRVYESHGHREWCMGAAGCKVEDNLTAVIPNFFDPEDFRLPRASTPKLDVMKDWLQQRPYFLFIGRIIADKGIGIAEEAAGDLGVPLVIAGQGAIENKDPTGIYFFGHAGIEERSALLNGAAACFCPTHFREPFGGTAVEAQLCGTPAITTDHGAFCETVAAEWRCACHREFAEAGRRALALSPRRRQQLQTTAEKRFSLQAVAPLYERYFQRLTDLWGEGWYQEEPYAFDRVG